MKKILMLNGLLLFLGGIYLSYPSPVHAVSTDEVLSADLFSAETTTTTAAESAPKEIGVVSVIFRTLMALFLILAVSGLAIWAAKFFRVGPVMNGSHIRVLQRFPLSGRKELCVIKVAEKTMLIGISEQNISRLSTLNSADFQDVTLPPENSLKFSDLLTEKLRSLMGPHETK